MFGSVFKSFVVVLAIVLLSSSAHAAGEHTHDGFFLRLAPGLGFAKASEEVGSNKLELSGSTGLFNLSIGGAVTENLILHFDGSGVAAKDPKLKLNGIEYSTKDTTVSTSLVGIGLTYYFPSNTYLTAAGGIAESTLKLNGKEYKSDKGFGVNIMLGHEWWVSDNWGLGIAGQYLFTKCPDKPVNGVTPDINASSFGVLFSATYN